MPIFPQGKIIKAAVIFNGITYLGWRHAHIRDDIINLVNPTHQEMSATMSDEWKVGFITENGRFLTRKQALTYGRHIGQIVDIQGSVLTSEDLWDADGNKNI